MSRVRAITTFGQQVWLDKLSRHLLQSGELRRMVEDDGISGVTSNPTIFHGAIRDDVLYRASLAELRAAEPSPERRFERLVLPDVRDACDLLRPTWERAGGQEGHVSFEVSPALAHDAAGTYAAALRLWAEIDRSNAMIKIPATPAGIQAVRGAVASGINVNVTLMFSQRHAEQVFDAYVAGLQDRLNDRLPVAGVRAVASVFVSRVDAQVDALLDEADADLRGRVAIASAKGVYRLWQQRFEGPGFGALRAAGAHAPSCLWASTGTKNPAYRDTLYVEALIGPHTVNTVPDATLVAFRAHGVAAPTLTTGLQEAQAVLDRVRALGIDLDALGERLQRDGLRQFDDALAKLLTLVV